MLLGGLSNLGLDPFVSSAKEGATSKRQNDQADKRCPDPDNIADEVYNRWPIRIDFG
jgi:hypothetical protein